MSASGTLSSAAKLLAVETAVPNYYHTLDDMLPYIHQWIEGKDEIFCSKVEKIFRNAAVDGRHTVLDIHEIFAERSFEASNRLYQEHIISLAYQAFEKALKRANINASQIDCIITTSCTGHMSPSLETYLINHFEINPTVQRLPVTEMGCAGGAAGLTYALNYLKAYPDSTIVLISGELTSLTFQRDDYSWANIVSSAIFGDGVACAIFGPSKNPGIAITGAQMMHIPNTTNLLGFQLSNTGFKMILDESLPQAIQTHLPETIDAFLASHQLLINNISHFVVHPGGKKILHNVEQLVKKHHKHLKASWEILKTYGNLSSATVLFILKELLASESLSIHEKILLMAFGPGVMANQVLMSYEL